LITEKYSTREDHSLIKRDWREHWKWISHRKAENSYDLKTTGEIFQKLFGDDIVDPELIAEVKRIIVRNRMLVSLRGGGVN
jgi:hypothetical protein